MCTMIVEKVEMSGSGKGPQGWFALREASISFDHPFHAALEHAVSIDFVNHSAGLGARVAVELSPASARDLIATIETALARGHDLH